MTREETERRITQALADIESALAAITAALEGTGMAADDEGARGHHGIATHYNTAREQLEEATATLTTTQTKLEHAQSAISQTTAQTATSPAPRDPLPTAKPSNSGMQGIRPYRVAGTAEGNLFIGGQKINASPLRATPARTQFRPGEIKPDLQHTKPAQGHIEGNVAAEMLHRDATTATLYLNAEPCDNAGNGCKDNTAHYLREGSALQIKVHDEAGRLRYRKRVTGTGEALTDD